jgi:hypothetical protein
MRTGRLGGAGVGDGVTVRVGVSVNVGGRALGVAAGCADWVALTAGIVGPPVRIPGRAVGAASLVVGVDWEVAIACEGISVARGGVGKIHWFAERVARAKAGRFGGS